MFQSLSVAKRIMLGFGGVVLLLAVVAGVGIFRITSLGTGLQRLGGVDLQILQRVAVLQVALLRTGSAVRDAVSQEDLKVYKEAIATVAENQKISDAAFKELADLTSISDAAEFGKIQAEVPAFVKEVRAALDLVDSAEYDAAKRHVVEKVRPLQRQIAEELTAIFKKKTEVGNQLAEAALVSARNARTLLIILTVLAIGIGLFMSWAIARSVVTPLREAVDFARQVSSGDLSRSIKARSTDEVGTLITALETMRMGLAQLIGKIRGEGEQVSRLAKDLADRTQVVDEHSSVQTERIQAVSSAMNQMSASVTEVSNSASGVREASANAQRLTEDGNNIMLTNLHEVEGVIKAVGESSAIVEELAESVGKIRDMAGVIKEIADQTNLLALNAAIEAARAGEQGRGFAVVADEVRKLAERTTASTADIANKVNEISGRTADAVNAMNRVRADVEREAEDSRAVGQRLAEITRAAEEVTALADQIASAAREQAAGSQQTVDYMADITSITDETRAAIREAGSSAQEMAKTAITMQQLVSQFRL